MKCSCSISYSSLRALEAVCCQTRTIEALESRPRLKLEASRQPGSRQSGSRAEAGRGSINTQQRALERAHGAARRTAHTATSGFSELFSNFCSATSKQRLRVASYVSRLTPLTPMIGSNLPPHIMKTNIFLMSRVTSQRTSHNR